MRREFRKAVKVHSVLPRATEYYCIYVLLCSFTVPLVTFSSVCRDKVLCRLCASGQHADGLPNVQVYQRHASLTYNRMLLSRIFNPSHLPLRRLAAPLLTTNRVLLVNMSIFNASRLQNKTVLITGASGGIGEVGGRN